MPIKIKTCNQQPYLSNEGYDTIVWFLKTYTRSETINL